MKFVHIADMHFDIPFASLESRIGLGDKRRLQQRKVFKKMIEYIKENKIPYLFIAGDLYEHEYIRNSTIEYINQLFEEIPDTQIYITPGNHDPFLNNSYYSKFSWAHNVHIFNDKIEKIEQPDCNIYGLGFKDFYMMQNQLESFQLENKEKINIFITHASLDSSAMEERQYNPIGKGFLKSLGFDYVALGHIHKNSYQDEADQRIVYPGSMISLGFDELGSHGMIVGELEKKELKLTFIPLDEQEFVTKKFDITTISSQEELIEKLNELDLEKDKFYEIVLVGVHQFELNKMKILKLIEKEEILKLKDETTLGYDLEKLKEENTLKGIFVRQLLEEKTKENYSEETIKKAMEIGLEILE